MIYLDYNATTPLCAAAWRAMQPYFEKKFGNPSSVHRAGRETRAAIERAPDVIDVAVAGEAWEAALASAWEGPPVWVHGDVAPSNLLVGEGVLRAVIDFGCSAVGDPACDLVMAWTFFDGESRAMFRDSLAFDEATWSRARGWALWKALITLVGARATGPDPEAAARRWGWRFSPLDVVESVLAEHS
jgi:aminoglycoside phosphotransferase (APT) family kinase protein